MISSVTLDAFGQLEQVLYQIDQNEYTHKLALLRNTSIGAHVRHMLEFYECLFNGTRSTMVDYCNRKRDMRLEEDLQVALARLQSLKGFIQDHTTSDADLKLHTEYKGQVMVTITSLYRELVYLIEHNIHHFAILEIAIRTCYPKVEVPANFGVAHATIKHKDQHHLHQHKAMLQG